MQSFNKLNELILQHSKETSGLICIFLDWDDKRQEIIRRIIAVGIPVHVYLITDRQDAEELDPGPLRDKPEHFTVLQTGKVQEQLDRMNSRVNVL